MLVWYSNRQEAHLVVWKKKVKLLTVLAISLGLFFFPPHAPVLAEDWPTYQHDNQRSGITPERLGLPLHCQWVLTPRQTPHTAWEESPAKRDLWHGFKDLKPRSLFDRANYVSVVGNSVFFGSSSDDIVCSRNLETGEEQWVFFTEGPVRFAPTVFQGKVYAGADDGYVYCLDAASGGLIWKYKANSQKDMIVGNGRMISVWPVRTSIIVQNNTVFFGAGIFPLEGVYLGALQADRGTVIWQKTISDSPQGYLLSAANSLFLPTGNTNPAVYSAVTGEKRGSFSQGRSGGTYALIVDDKLVSGPGYSETGSNWLHTYNTASRARVASFQGNHVIVAASRSYLHTDDALTAIDRDIYFKTNAREIDLQKRSDTVREQIKKLSVDESGDKRSALIDELSTLQADLIENEKVKATAVLWTSPCTHPYSLIAAGDLLFAGGDGEVAAYDMEDGALRWKDQVTGRAYGLAAANGSLLVSTDRGTIHRFSTMVCVPQWLSY